MEYLSKFKKCVLCDEIASFKVWLKDTKTNKRYSGIYFCKYCFKEHLEEDKDRFSFLDLDSHDDSVNRMMTMRKVISI